MNLYPYNYYILYVSLFVTAFFLMMTIVKLPTLLKSLNHLSANIETISKHSEGLSETIHKMEEEGKKRKIKLTPQQILELLFLYGAIRKDYKKSPDHTVKQVGKSTTNVLYSRGKQKLIQDELVRIIKNNNFLG